MEREKAETKRQSPAARQPQKAELLAPAGSFESMKAAIAAGADAVYIGGSRFGARAYADNLDRERMLEAIDYAHLHGASLYMTVNTLVKEKELSELYDYLLPFYRQGLDAVIVQDLGVLAAVGQWFPDMHIHASTQMSVTGAEGARLLKDLGVRRVVTARELSLEELRDIHEKADIEIESFVHGALCYCYSGQCLLSSLIGGRSGNRGRCAQPCRLPYEAKTAGGQAAGRDGERYVMSLKDLCTLDLLPDILESGVYSLKIEGRMKSPRYTAGVVSIYRKYVDLYLRSGRDGYRVDEADRKILLDLFDRGGFTQGYYRQHNGKDMLVLKEKPAFRQVNQPLFDELDRRYVNCELKESISGQVEVRAGRPMRLKLQLKGAENVRDFAGTETTGAVVQEARNQPLTEETIRQQLCRTGGTPFEFGQLTVDLDPAVFVPVQALNELRRKGLADLLEAALSSRRRSGPEGGEPAGKDKTEMAESIGKAAEMAKSLEKPKNAAPAGTEEPKTSAGAGPEPRAVSGRAGKARAAAGEKLRLHVLISDGAQFGQALAEPDADEIQIESDALPPESWREAADRCRAAGKRPVLALPVIYRREAEEFFRRWERELAEAGFDGFLVRSLEELGLLRRIFPKQSGTKRPFVCSDHNLYVFNHLAAETVKGFGVQRLTLPLELNGRELEALRGTMPLEAETEMAAWGFLPVMTTAQCVRRTVSGCSHRPELMFLRDRTGKNMPVYNHCRFCYNTIYNPTPLSFIGMEETIERIRPSSLRLQFLSETPREMSAVIRAYGDAFLRGIDCAQPARAFTRGHLKRGVE